MSLQASQNPYTPPTAEVSELAEADRPPSSRLRVGLAALAACALAVVATVAVFAILIAVSKHETGKLPVSTSLFRYGTILVVVALSTRVGAMLAADRPLAVGMVAGLLMLAGTGLPIFLLEGREWLPFFIGAVPPAIAAFLGAAWPCLFRWKRRPPA